MKLYGDYNIRAFQKGSLVLTILNLVLIELIKKIKSLVKNGNEKKGFLVYGISSQKNFWF